MPAYALSDTKTAAVSATVTPLFSVSISINTLDFGNVQAGSWTELKTAGGSYHNKVVGKSNNGLTWYIKVKVNQALTSGTNSIPLANFQWMCAYVGSENPPYGQGTGVLANPIAYIPFTTSDNLVYTCGADEKSNLPNGIGAQFNYGLSVPDTQPAGSYTATITYTMTETL